MQPEEIKNNPPAFQQADVRRSAGCYKADSSNIVWYQPSLQYCCKKCGTPVIYIGTGYSVADQRCKS